MSLLYQDCSTANQNRQQVVSKFWRNFPMSDFQTVGGRLGFAIDKIGKTRAEVGSWLGMTSQAVSSWVANRTSLKIEDAAILAKRLNVSLDWLAGLCEEENRSISHRESLVLRIFNAIEKEGLEQIADSIDRASQGGYARALGPEIVISQQKSP